jgi:hypothetical protein
MIALVRRSDDRWVICRIVGGVVLHWCGEWAGWWNLAPEYDNKYKCTPATFKSRKAARMYAVDNFDLQPGEPCYICDAQPLKPTAFLPVACEDT